MKIRFEPWIIYFDFKSFFRGFNLKKFKFEEINYLCASCEDVYNFHRICLKCWRKINESISFKNEYESISFKLSPKYIDFPEFISSLTRMHPCAECKITPIDVELGICHHCSAARYEKHKEKIFRESLKNLC